MTRYLLFSIGLILSLIGFIYLISYLNLLSIGYTFEEYVNFIISKFECYLSVIGFFIMFYTIRKEKT